MEYSRMTAQELKEFRPICKEAGQHIDPATAKVVWEYVDLTDPYGIEPPHRVECVGLQYFALSPGTDIWVWFGDLPEATAKALRERVEVDPDRETDGADF
jgi:hypothetical protein